MRRLLRRTALGRVVLILAIVLGFWLIPAEGQTNGVEAASLPPFEDGTVLVGFHAGVPDAVASAIEQRESAARVAVIGAGTHVLRVGKGQVAARIAALQRHAEVRYAEPNYILQAIGAPNDPSYPSLWGLKNAGQTVNGIAGTAGADIEAEPAWAVTTGTPGVVVGVVDTGVDYTHPDLAANVWGNPGGMSFTIGGVAVSCGAGTHGFNASTGACDPMDDHNHGTHVAGTIGAVGNNAAGVVGVNWTTSIMGLKFLSASGSGSTTDAIKAIDFAVQAKQAGVNVRVLSNSWGGGGFSQSLLDEINKAGTNGILFVVAAGNSNANVDAGSYYPCSYTATNLICVAATGQIDNRASFSNYGATSVDLGAPGTNVLSTVRSGGYAYYNGTSMATPHVSGAAALILSVPALGSLTVAQLKSTILNNVDPIPALAGITVTGGRLNVCKTIPGCSTTSTPTAPAAPALSATAGNATVRLSWTTPADGGSPVTNYRVYRHTASGGESFLAILGVVNAYDDNTAINGITYFYKVRAVNAVGDGALSNEVSATPQEAAAPSAPRNLVATAAKGKGVALSWSPPTSGGSGPITGYRIYRRAASGAESFYIAVGNVTKYKDTGTARGVTYYYKVTAVNAADEGAPSNEASAVAR